MGKFMGHGGKRPGAGRKPGGTQRATAEQLQSLAELARAHTGAAIGALVAVATASDSDAARVSAASALLDRGYGKPRQVSEPGGGEGGPVAVVFRTVYERRPGE